MAYTQRMNCSGWWDKHQCRQSSNHSRERAAHIATDARILKHFARINWLLIWVEGCVEPTWAVLHTWFAGICWWISIRSIVLIKSIAQWYTLILIQEKHPLHSIQYFEIEHILSNDTAGPVSTRCLSVLCLPSISDSTVEVKVIVTLWSLFSMIEGTATRECGPRKKMLPT